METRDGVRWRGGRGGEVLVRLGFKQARMEIRDRGSSLHNGTCGQFGGIQGNGWKYLVFRTFGVENRHEELTVSILALGELERGKDLSKRWRCGLRWVSTRVQQKDRERADLVEDPPGGVEEMVGVVDRRGHGCRGGEAMDGEKSRGGGYKYGRPRFQV